ncbi:MAG: hypothetical protein A2V81_00805 [Candidatus Abawacabacteria bacterium RBG_16_42_10]|uniref:DUF4013 domain-containing protein n=1 Tax=Candidatus Abawacabacteria bacterium RBG_16_42_10 TaxID=1817814 RepID=A0A1F4XHY7_9BACT|nr:MAG: hypothetical protein A2V81_00805 [Candidatus Abawacabacteria bacterium RBG_16_42_10]
MNFYPHLVQAYQVSKKFHVFLISNSPWIFLLLITILVWGIWSESFFSLLKSTLSNTEISPEAVETLFTQSKQISKWLLFFLPLFLIIWRISQPLTLRLLSTSETNFLDGFWRIFLFDIVKVLIIFLAIKTSMVFLQDKDLLAITATTITTLIGLSFVHYFQTVYFVSPHKHLFSAFIRTWIHHFPEILFLHFIDIFVLIITFCLSGIVLASFIYLPFFLFLFISILVIYLLGRLFIIWKGLWAYAALSLITDRT